MKSRAFVFLLILTLFSSVAVHAQTTATWEGNYQAVMTLPDGTGVGAGLEIVAKDGYYQLMWLPYDSQNAIIGVGLPITDTLMAVATDASCVVQVFGVADDGTLSGPWAESFKGTGEETSTPSALMDGMDVGGDYDANGVNPDGSAYSGQLHVAPVTDEIYSLNWTLNDGTYSGIGLRADTLLVAAADVDPNSSCGVGLMKPDDAGNLQAIWGFEGSTDIISEQDTRITLASHYTITGKAPDGTDYTGTIDVTGNSGARYLLTYATGSNNPVNAVAVLRGNLLTSAIGSEQCAVVARARLTDGRLYTRTATLANETVGSTVQTPLQPTENFLGDYDLAGTAATGATTTGQISISGGENGIFTGAGQATRSTGETVDLASTYLQMSGLLSGVYAPGGDVTRCGAVVSFIAPDRTIAETIIFYGQPDIVASDFAFPG